MSFNIEVEGGSSVRLPTAGKYCDRDIVVTAHGGAEAGIEHLMAYEIEDLILWYSIGWYDSITTALEDIKNGTIGANALTDSTGATVGVYEDNGTPCIVLVEDFTIGEQITVEDIYINLNGCVLNSTDSVAVEVSGNSTIDGRAKESKIIASRTAVNVTDGECTIIGGAYKTEPLGTGVSDSPDGVLVVAADAKLNLSHASVISTDNNGGTICGIWAKGNSIINASDCNFEIASKRGFNVCGVYGDGSGEATFTNCSIVADADHTANAAGTNYATMSRAIHYKGTLYLYDCYVYGTHSGVTPEGDITVIGGTYEGYSHGGIYLYCGNNGVNKTAHIYDATVKECALHDGYIDDGVAGTNYAGIYSAGSNTTFYIDNCNLYATAQVIVMKGTNNTLHISRTHINHTYWRTAIRLDSSTHKVYIGANCNFSKDDTDRASVCTETDEVYRPFVENVQIPDGYIKPSGELEVTENGTHDVTAYASVNVNVATGGGGSGDLPAGYSRVDYIQFDGTQTVDTGIICNQNTKIQLAFTRERSSQHYVFGVASSDNTASVTAYMGGSWRFGNKSATKTLTTNANMIYSGVVDKTNVTITGSASGISDVNEFETVGSLLLGACRNSNGTLGESQFIGKIFFFAMWEDDEQVLKLVPVTDGTVFRFYDMVSKAFFDSITDTPLDGGNL